MKSWVRSEANGRTVGKKKRTHTPIELKEEAALATLIFFSLLSVQCVQYPTLKRDFKEILS